MGKNAEKKMCWNCDATVSMHFASCPYCGVDLSVEPTLQPENPFQGKSLGNPFQHSPQYEDKAQAAVLRDPNEIEKEEISQKNNRDSSSNKDVLTFLLLLPGSVLLLFALFILFFSDEGTLTLQWSQSASYFYFITSLPLLYLGWKVSR